MKCKCPSHIHFIAIFVNFHFLFHYNDHIITKCCRPTCLRLTGPVQMWLMKPPGVKWPMLCQRDKPELKVRPVGQVKTLWVRHTENNTPSVSRNYCQRGGRRASHQHQSQFLRGSTHTCTGTTLQEVPHDHTVSISQSCSQEIKRPQHFSLLNELMADSE